MLFDILDDAVVAIGLRALVAMAWKSSLLLSMAALLSKCLSRRPAALRHLVWTTGLFGALMMPLLVAIVPDWSIPILTAAKSGANLDSPQISDPAPAANLRPRVVPAVAMLDGPSLEHALASQWPIEPRQGASKETPPPTSSDVASLHANGNVKFFPQALITIWLAGAAIVLIRVLVGYVALQRLATRSEVIEGAPLAFELAQTAHGQGILRRVRLVLSAQRSIPMTWGVLRPVLLLPREAASWPDERLRVVLLHELAHVARFDYLTQLVGTLACALHWYNPLSWWGLRQLKIDQELACDDRVLSTGTPADLYACELLHVTSQYPRPRFTPSAALAIGRVARIQSRLESILDDSRDRRPLSLRSGGTAALACLLTASVIASVQATADGPTTASRPNTADQPAVSNQSAGAAAIPATTDPNSPTAFVTPTAPKPTNADPHSRLSVIREKILTNYVKSPDEKRLDEGAIRGMLQALDDPHSEFLSPEKLKELERVIGGILSGIGVQVSVAETQLNVITALDNSPAQDAGLVTGDAILAVDGKAVRELGPSDAIEAIRGISGTGVSLLVKRKNGEEQSIEVTRGAIRVPTTKGLWRMSGKMLDITKQWQYWLDPKQKLGYLQILEFGKGTCADCRAIIEALQSNGLKGLILDLRACPGGLLATAAEIADLFLREGTIVSIKGEHSPETALRATGKSCLGDFPLLVIVDDRTASAAEIFAGALQDHGRATILGMRTFGKGSVQSILPVNGEGAIRLTTAYFYLPSGRRIDRQTAAESWGIEPSEGYAVTLSPEQQARRISERQEWEIYGDSLKRAQEHGSVEIAAVLDEILVDLQLLAAYRCMAARLAEGTAPNARRDEQAVKDEISRRERLIKARADAQKKIDQIDKELSGARGAQ